jgi:hypothetical protein
MRRKMVLSWSHFVDSKINQPSDDNELLTGYHGGADMCTMHIDER